MRKDGGQLEHPRSDLLLAMAAQVVEAYMRGNRIGHTDVPGAVRDVHATLNQLASGGAAASEQRKPAVPVKKSVGDDYVVCLEDGKRLTMLKRYLKTHFNMTPEEYRKKWDLPHDYPMVAPAYARLRSAFAKKIGLGRVATPRRRLRGR